MLPVILVVWQAGAIADGRSTEKAGTEERYEETRPGTRRPPV